MIVNVHIDQVVLDGVAVGPLESAVLQGALYAELSRLFAVDAVPASLGAAGVAVPALAAAPLQMPSSPTPSEWGCGIARSVHRVVST